MWYQSGKSPCLSGVISSHADHHFGCARSMAFKLMPSPLPLPTCLSSRCTETTVVPSTRPMSLTRSGRTWKGRSPFLNDRIISQRRHMMQWSSLNLWNALETRAIFPMQAMSEWTAMETIIIRISGGKYGYWYKLSFDASGSDRVSSSLVIILILGSSPLASPSSLPSLSPWTLSSPWPLPSASPLHSRSSLPSPSPWTLSANIHLGSRNFWGRYP